MREKYNTFGRDIYYKEFATTYPSKFLNSWVFSGYSARPVYSEYNSNEIVE